MTACCRSICPSCDDTRFVASHISISKCARCADYNCDSKRIRPYGHALQPTLLLLIAQHTYTHCTSICVRETRWWYRSSYDGEYGLWHNNKMQIKHVYTPLWRCMMHLVNRHRFVLVSLMRIYSMSIGILITTSFMFHSIHRHTQTQNDRIMDLKWKSFPRTNVCVCE